MGQSFESANKDGNKLDSFPELQSGWAFFFSLAPASFLFPQCYFESAKRKMSGDSAATLPTGCCSVAKSCLTLCDPLDCSTPGFPALHHLPEFILKLMSIESVMPSDHLNLCHPFSSCPQSFPSSGSFSVSRLFAQGGQSIGASASTLNIHWMSCMASLVAQG